MDFILTSFVIVSAACLAHFLLPSSAKTSKPIEETDEYKAGYAAGISQPWPKTDAVLRQALSNAFNQGWAACLASASLRRRNPPE